MFVLQSNITIGPFSKVKPHEVRIKKSLFEYVDKATIKLPITARIRQAGEIVTQSTETAKQFSEGDAVTIQLGYNRKLRTEFEGFISRINFTAPLEVECEGYSYQLRKRTYKRTFVKAQLLDVLKYLVAGTDIELDEANIPAFLIEKLVIQEHSGTDVLEMLKKISHNTIQAHFNGKRLYAGLIFSDLKKRKAFRSDVKYRMSWNVIKDGNLKLRQAKNQDVTVNFIGLKNDGSRTEAKVGTRVPKVNTIKTVGKAGDVGENKMFKSHGITDQQTLNEMAQEKHTTLSYDGYEGKITAFLQPYCQPGDRAELYDLKYPERTGAYLVESTEVTYSTSGARRIVGIGLKL